MVSLTCYYFYLKCHIIVQVIPPGMEFHHIVPHDGDTDGDVERNDDDPASPDPPIWSEVMTCLSSPLFGLWLCENL